MRMLKDPKIFKVYAEEKYMDEAFKKIAKEFPDRGIYEIQIVAADVSEWAYIKTCKGFYSNDEETVMGIQ
jgi:hypothetical protein